MIPGHNPSDPLRCLREYCDEDLITERRDILASLERRDARIREVLDCEGDWGTAQRAIHAILGDTNAPIEVWRIHDRDEDGNEHVRWMLPGDKEPRI